MIQQYKAKSQPADAIKYMLVLFISSLSWISNEKGVKSQH